MSRSNKSRHGMKCKFWKDSLQVSHNQTKTGMEWKKINSRSARRKAKQTEGRERHGKNSRGLVPRDRLKGVPKEDE